MRLFRAGRSRVAVVTCAVGALLGTSTSAATADDPSVARIEARLAQSRAHLNELYAASATAGQQFTAATQQVAEADRAVKRERSQVKKARAELADQSAAVAELTVQQVQEQVGVQRFATLLHSGGPQELLERSAAYDSASEAMTAQVDELSARSAVHAAAQHRFEKAKASKERALAELANNRASINAAIARSQAETQAAATERATLLKQLAAKKHESIHAVAAEQQAAAASTPDTSATENPTQPADDAPNSRQPEKPTSQPAASPPVDESSSDEPYGVWDKIAKCESGSNWHINTGNGYYGGLQFSAATWKSVGGPGLPHQYSREVQIKYAKILQARSGWGQWSCAGARFD